MRAKFELIHHALPCWTPSPREIDDQDKMEEMQPTFFLSFCKFSRNLEMVTIIKSMNLHVDDVTHSHPNVEKFIQKLHLQPKLVIFEDDYGSHP